MRIYVDTEGLHSLASSLRAESQESGDIAVEVMRITEAIPAVPSAGAARGRGAAARSQVGELARVLHAEGNALDHYASHWEAKERGVALGGHSVDWSGWQDASKFLDQFDQWIGLTDKGFSSFFAAITTRVAGHLRSGKYIKGFQQYRRGLAPTLRHFGTAKQAGVAIGRLSLFAGVLGGVAAYGAQRSLDSSRSDLTASQRNSRALAAGVIDAGARTAGQAIGQRAGAAIGIAAGTALGGPVGAVVGGFVGSALGGAAGEWVGGKASGVIKRAVFGSFPSVFGR